MKICILMGSPRKDGNTEAFAAPFIKRMEEAGHICRKIRLYEKDLRPCVACRLCQRDWTVFGCPQPDDMAEIFNQIAESDLLVLATPVYFYSMDGQLKTLIDRTLPRYTEIRNKDFYFIATAAAGPAAMERTMDALAGFTDCLPGAKVKDRIYGSGVYQKGEVRSSQAMSKAYQDGRTL